MARAEPGRAQEVWIAIIAVLNVIVPQLEEVGEMRSVSMTPDDAPSMIAMKRVGQVFDEFKSNSSVMIVLESDHALDQAAHDYYDQIVAKLRADTKHIEHVQDFWGDPLTASGAQSSVQTSPSINIGGAISARTSGKSSRKTLG